MPSPVAVAALRTLVLAPLRIGRALFGERIWPVVETASRIVGHGSGVLLRPLMRASGDAQARLSALLRLTELVEGALGIEGTNLVEGDEARRVVHQCPYAASLRDMPEFCTAIGKAAADGAFGRIAPGSKFEILRTQSRGHGACEYVYRA